MRLWRIESKKGEGRKKLERVSGMEQEIRIWFQKLNTDSMPGTTTTKKIQILIRGTVMEWKFEPKREDYISPFFSLPMALFLILLQILSFSASFY